MARNYEVFVSEEELSVSTKLPWGRRQTFQHLIFTTPTQLVNTRLVETDADMVTGMIKTRCNLCPFDPSKKGLRLPISPALARKMGTCTGVTKRPIPYTVLFEVEAMLPRKGTGGARCVKP